MGARDYIQLEQEQGGGRGAAGKSGPSVPVPALSLLAAKMRVGAALKPLEEALLTVANAIVSNIRHEVLHSHETPGEGAACCVSPRAARMPGWRVVSWTALPFGGKGGGEWRVACGM